MHIFPFVLLKERITFNLVIVNFYSKFSFSIHSCRHSLNLSIFILYLSNVLICFSMKIHKSLFLSPLNLGWLIGSIHCFGGRIGFVSVFVITLGVLLPQLIDNISGSTIIRPITNNFIIFFNLFDIIS